MSILQRISEEENLKSYWQSLLGEKELERILENAARYEEFLERDFSLEKEKVQEFLTVPVTKALKEEKEWVFLPFYKRMSCYVQRKLDKVFQTKHLISVAQKISGDLAGQYIKGIQEIPLRCLLREMTELKEQGELQGEDEKQEYEFFLREYLESTEYLGKLAAKYPVMIELLLRKAEAYVQGMEDLLNHLEQEKATIENCLCQGRKIRKIVKLETGLSDEHKPGRTVTKLIFDNKYTIYYKPRELRQEKEYEKLYHWVCSGCGMENYNRGILDCGSHGWENQVITKECRKEAEVQRYYQRVGIHLCLTYLFGISDIHFENLIACGEYPVLIDMELFPGCQESVLGVLETSVLNSGILPGKTWGKAGVNVGALGSIKEQKSPFKVPVISDKNTSKMHISYDYAKVNSAVCVPKLNGRRIQADRFVEEVEIGFDKAYEYIFLHKETLIEKIAGIENWKSRYVRNHTQQYRMYQMAATFPEFMMDSEARRLLLLRMSGEDVCFYEAETVMQGMIPVYYVKGRNLEYGDGTVVSDYLAEDVWAQVIKRLIHMSGKDKYHQQKLIALSMLAENGGWRQPEKETIEQEISVSQIAELVQLDAEQQGDEVWWTVLEYGKEGKWQFQKMGKYLYDGIAGIAVFLMAYVSMHETEGYQELLEEVIESLFEYTDTGIANIEELQSRRTGIMNGESSLVYTYLVLYRISQEDRFLEYAKKHTEIVRKLIGEDIQSDILEGNAGAILALVHLFQITGDTRYQNTAQQAADILLEHRIETEQQIAWKIPEQEYSLAGMAHGNSGIMLAFARLFSITGIERYRKVAEKAGRYEDSLYEENHRNWKDRRGEQESHRTDTVAWCHGAAGILMAGTAVNTVAKKQVIELRHLEKAEEKVANTYKKENCLCHGNAGNAAALRYVGRESEGLLKGMRLTYGEKYQMSFMTGLSGIGYELLKRENPKLPEVLALEL